MRGLQDSNLGERQGFIDASSPGGPGVTIAPLDAFMVRLDLDPLMFEALGNDQNYREVTQDQDGVKEFRFRYALRGHTGGYDNAQALAWSRSVTAPHVSFTARMADDRAARPAVQLDPFRAIATCLKPADGEGSAGVILRFWETAGKADPIQIALKGYSRAVQTDLLERDRGELPIMDGRIEVKTNPYGFSSVRLLP